MERKEEDIFLIEKKDWSSFLLGEMWEVERKEEDKNGMVTDLVSVLKYLY